MAEEAQEAQPTPMDRLEAAFWLLLRSEEVDLPRAKRAARAIVGLMDDDEEAAPAAETLSKPDAPAQHARPGSALHYLASPPAPDAPASKDGRILARLYAICYAALEAAGSHLPEGELEEANGELAPFGWAVERHGDSWAAVPAEEGGPERFQKEGAHRFGCILALLPPDAAETLLAMGKAIPDEDLAEDGREDEPHVTALFGLHQDDPAPAARIAAAHPPLALRLGKLSLFPAKEGSDFDVLKLDVGGEGIHSLHDALAEGLEHTATHPKFVPHATIAYLRAGLGKRYLGMDNPLEGETAKIPALAFSDRQRKRTLLPLRGREGPRRFSKSGLPLVYAMRAPAGGVTVGGVFYAGGKFIPSAALVGQAVMPGGQAVDAASLPGQQQAAQQAYASGAPAASEAVGAVRTLAQSFPSPGSAPAGASRSVVRLLRSAHGHEAPRRLFRLAALLKRAKESLDARQAPPDDYRSLADSAAVLAEAAGSLAPSPEAADEARFLIPDDGRLWLLPGVPAGEEEEFEAAGFVRAAPGRWAAPDSEEARSLALERGFRLAMPQDDDGQR